jgi:hypothetical protein
MPSVKLLTLAVLASAVCGQQTMWGQCGGMGEYLGGFHSCGDLSEKLLNRLDGAYYLC